MVKVRELVKVIWRVSQQVRLSTNRRSHIRSYYAYKITNHLLVSELAGQYMCLVRCFVVYPNCTMKMPPTPSIK